MREKQKARYSYGIMERQFRRYYKRAIQRTGVTGQNLLSLLEMRLDNVVYRLGFADSRNQARQFVRHGHIAVNGRKTDVPSALVRVGDAVTWTEAARAKEPYKFAQEAMKNKRPPSWLSVEEATMTGRVLAAPGPGEIEARFDPSVIVEFYSR